MRLADKDRIYFSPREQKILTAIGARKLTLSEISSKVFNKNKGPLDTNITISNSIRRIIRKCEHYDLSWTLVKTRENNKMTIHKEKV